MKPGLAILPLEVWADVFETPVITRQELAQLANHLGNRGFTNKLQKLLHGCGKHSLRFLQISSKQSDQGVNNYIMQNFYRIADTAVDHGFINKLRECGKQTLQYFGISTREPAIVIFFSNL